MKNSTKLADFASLSLSPELIQTTAEVGYERLTPIQAESIPLLLQGRDIIGQSKTGSGKTVAFSLPILQKIRLSPRALQALILCPTRELCSQVAREVRKLGRHQAGLQVLILSGGQPKFPQKKSLESGIHIVVGTPGRVLDHLQGRSLDLSEVGTIVLDEADRMLDMGFAEDMEKILKALPKKRQMAFFSATFPSTIKAMSVKYQTNPEKVTIQEGSTSTGQIEQFAYETDEEKKSGALIKLLSHYAPGSAIIFCNQKATVVELTNTLSQKGFSAGCLHGDLEQKDRDRVMAKFRNESIRILVATDVAARGIDVADLDAVFNFDLPVKPDIYLHRIGRTGRAGKMGRAISLVPSHLRWKLTEIEEACKIKILVGSPSHLQAPKLGSDKTKMPAMAQMDTLYISGGRKEKVRPGDILGALTGEAGRLNGSDIGKIEIHDHFSYVAVSSGVSQLAAKRLSEGKIKGRKFRVGLTR